MPFNAREIENPVDQDSRSTASTEPCEVYKESDEDSDVEVYYDIDAVDAWDTGCTDQDTGVNDYYNHETDTMVKCTSFERKVLLSNLSRNMVVESNKQMWHLQADLGKIFRDIWALEKNIMGMQEQYRDDREQSTYDALRLKLTKMINTQKQFQSDFVHVERDLELHVSNYKATLLVIKSEKTNKLIDAQLGLLMVHVTNKGFIEWYARLQNRGQSLSEEQVTLYKNYFETEAQYKAVDRNLRKMYLNQKQFQKRQDFEIRDVLETYSPKLR